MRTERQLQLLQMPMKKVQLPVRLQHLETGVLQVVETP